MANHGMIDVSALRILDGERKIGAPAQMGNLGVYQGGRDKGNLYVLVNAQGQQREHMEKLLVKTIIEAYQKPSKTTTGALKSAIKAANAVLYDDNKVSFDYERTRAGVYCAVVRPGEPLTLAYAGPAVALVIGAAGVERMYSQFEPPKVSAGAHALPPEDDLGVKEDIEVGLYSSQYRPGDTLVLATPELFDCGLDDEEMGNAISELGVDGLPDSLDMTVLLLHFVEGVDEDGAAARGGALGAGGPALGARLQGTLQRLGSMLKRGSAGPAAEPKPVAAAPEPAAPAAPDAGIPEWLERPATTTARPRPQSGAQRPSLPKVSAPRLHIPWRYVAIAAALLLAIAGILWFRNYSAAKTRERNYQSLITQAQAKLTLGQASLDRNEAITHLQEAQTLAARALAIKPDAADAKALSDTIIRDMDEAKGVLRMAAAQITPLYTFTAAGATPGRVVGDGFNLYVLDKGEQKVYKFVLNPQGNGILTGGDSVLLRKGDQVGGAVIGDLIDIAWIPAGGSRGTSNLMILESGGSLIQYDVTKGLSVYAVKDASTWRKAQATGGYGGNFYVLDNLASTVLRYRPTARGYDEAPSAYLQTKVELASAVDMAIDGDVFVLMVNGQVIWLSGGRPQQFTLQGLDQAMSAPVAIFTNDGSASLYVADPSNTRVVKLSKQGVMQKQFVFEDFARLRGVFADEKKLSLYVTSGNKLLHLVLPQ